MPVVVDPLGAVAGCGGARLSVREDTLTLYTTIAEKDLPTLLGPFEAEHGIKVNVWRAGTDRIMQRTMSEAAAGRYDVDVIHFGSPEMEALARENILLAIDSPVHADLQPAPSRRTSSGPRRCCRCGCRPTTPTWCAARICRSRIAICSIRSGRESSGSRRRIRTGSRRSPTSWGRRRREGVEFFRQLAATNGVSVRVGHTLLNNMVISGEVPLALTLYNYMPEQAKKKGAPIDWFTLEPAIARSNAVGVARRAPHPAAARLFYDYLLGEDAQRSFVSMDYVPSNTKVPSPLAGVKILQTDPVRTLDEADKWTKLFEETLLKR